MKRYLLAFLLVASPAWAQNPNPPGHSETHVKHGKFRGGELHEAETDGVRDGIVIWKNGTSQAIHNGKLGRWFPTTFAREGDPIQAEEPGGVANDAVERAKSESNDALQRLGIVTPTASYMAAVMAGRAGADTTAVIDDYVFVSPSQVAAWGGMSGTINQVHLAEDAMNESFAHSGVNARQRVVGIAQYDVAETSGLFSNMTALATRYGTGYFNSLRASTGFDTLTLMVTQGDWCGQAYVFDSTHPLHVINGSNCATSNLSYAHECGHTMGLLHNIGDSGYAAICGPTAVGYGEARFRTVMSYPTATIDGVSHSYGNRTRQYSAPPPAKWYSDGVSAVGEVRTNAVGCLVKTVATVAAWHDTVIEIVPPPPANHTAPTNLTWTPSSSPPPPPPPPPTHTAPTTLLWTPEASAHTAPTGLTWTVTQ